MCRVHRVNGWSYNCAVVSSQIVKKHPSMYPFNLRSKPEFVDNFDCQDVGELLFRSTKPLDEILEHYSIHLCHFFLKENYNEELKKMNSLEAVSNNCVQTFCKLARYILE